MKRSEDKKEKGEPESREEEESEAKSWASFSFSSSCSICCFDDLLFCVFVHSFAQFCNQEKRSKERKGKGKKREQTRDRIEGFEEQDIAVQVPDLWP